MNTAQSGGKVTMLTLVTSPAIKCCSLMVEVEYEICKKERKKERKDSS